MNTVLEGEFYTERGPKLRTLGQYMKHATVHVWGICVTLYCEVVEDQS